MAIYPTNPGSTHSSVLEGIRDPANRSAWERFHAQYAPYLLALAARNGLRHADAEDVVQTVFAEIAGRIRTFEYDRAKGHFHVWLAKAALYRIGDLVRRNLRRESREEPLDPELPAPDAFEAIAEEEWRTHVLNLALQRLRAQISRGQFELFHASAVEGWPAAKTAQVYGTTRAAVYQATRRAKKLWTPLLREVRAELDAPPPPPPPPDSP